MIIETGQAPEPVPDIMRILFDTMKPIGFYILFWIVFPVFLLSAETCLAQEHGVAVLLSREIAPYVAMVEGLEQQLGNRSVQRFFLDKQGQVYGFAGGSGDLDPAQYDALVAVGPGALRYLQGRSGNVPLLFGMVLNPEKMFSDSEGSPCGVSLNISIAAQISAISEHLPDMTSLGILFDPANNQSWFDHAAVIAKTFGIQLLPLQVTHQREKITILGDLAAPDAILFIPDKTIIAKPIIQYIIKQAVLQRTPVVGYNQFFYDSGAALSFIIEYAKNGQQVAGLVESVLVGNRCTEVVAPAFTTRVNNDVLQVLQHGKEGGQ